MDEDGESSEGEGGRIAIIQRQARRRMLNMRHIPHASVDTTATLPEYTSSPPPESSSGTEVMTSPPKYPKLTAEEEADEERDAVGDVVRRVRVRRRRSMSMSSSGSDPYLDSLLARSVHALELSNALLQSTMSTKSSLSALLSHEVDGTLDRSLDSHARFLAGQIHASDARRAWMDDITRQVDSLEPPSPSGSAIGLSQSLPDSPDGFLGRMRAAGIGVNLSVPVPPSQRKQGQSSGLQQGERPRSPPPRCMTQYITAEANSSDEPDSILIPSTNGLRSGPRVHSFMPRSRQSSGEHSEFARQQQQISGMSTPVSAGLHSPRRASSVSAQHSPHVSIAGGVYQHGNMSSPQVLQHPHTPQSQYTSHQIHTPVRPVLSAVPAEPSTAAYNMLSAIVMRSPTPDGGAGGARADLGQRFMNDPGPRFINDLGPQAELVRGYGRGRGGSGTWLTAVGADGGSGLRRTRSATPSSRGGFVASPIVSPSARIRGNSTATSTTMSSPSRPNAQIAATGTASPVRSKPSSRTGSSASVLSVANPPAASGPSQTSPGPKQVIRHPFLQVDSPRRQNQTQPQSDPDAEQGFKSASVLRRILDASKAQHEEPEQQPEELVEEERGRAKGKQPARPRLRPPTWSVIPPTGTTVKLETVTPGGVVSIKGMSVSSVGGSKSAIEPAKLVDNYHDPLELPGEHPRPVSMPRSRSAGPSGRLGSLFAVASSLPKIPVVFGKGGDPEPPPSQEGSKQETAERREKGKERERPRLEIDTERLDGLPRRREHDMDESIEGLPKPGALRVQLNGSTIDTDAGPSDSRESSDAGETDSENGSSPPSHASLPLPCRLMDDQPSRRPSSLRLRGSPRPSLKQPGSGASTPRSVTFSPLPPKHVSSGRPLSEAKVVRRRKKEKEKEKPGWFATWFGPLPSPSGSSVKSGGYGPAARRGWDSPRSMDDWQM